MSSLCLINKMIKMMERLLEFMDLPASLSKKTLSKKHFQQNLTKRICISKSKER